MSSFPSSTEMAPEDNIDDDSEDEDDQQDDTFQDWTEDEGLRTHGDISAACNQECEVDELLQSLFDKTRHRSLNELLDHDSICFGFDINMLVSTLREKSFVVEDTSVIAVVNFIRFRVASLASDLIDRVIVADLYREILGSIDDIINDERYMIPVLQDDALLYLLPDHLGVACWSDDDRDDGSREIAVGGQVTVDVSGPVPEEDARRLQAVRAELSSCLSITNEKEEERGASI